MTINLEDELARVHRDLLMEEHCRPISSISETTLRKKKRQEIQSRLDMVRREVRCLYLRFERLPRLPDIKSIKWAQSVLAFSNACILTVDVDASTGDAVILRIHLLDLSETTLFDQVLAPGYILTTHTMRTWGITHQDMQNACSLPQVWDPFLDFLMGRFVVCYDFERVRTLLEEHARQYELEPPVILGDCLLEHMLHYFHSTGFTGLPALCRHIGYPLPEPPDCTILDRARGQLHLLRVMAQGIAGGGGQPSLGEEPNDDLAEISLGMEKKRSCNEIAIHTV